jgi:hypothetical protein
MLVVKSEMELLNSICYYITAHQADLTPDQIRELLSAVNFFQFGKDLPTVQVCVNLLFLGFQVCILTQGSFCAQSNEYVSKYAQDLLSKGVVARMVALESGGLTSLKCVTPLFSLLLRLRNSPVLFCSFNLSVVPAMMPVLISSPPRCAGRRTGMLLRRMCGTARRRASW